MERGLRTTRAQPRRFRRGPAGIHYPWSGSAFNQFSALNVPNFAGEDFAVGDFDNDGDKDIALASTNGVDLFTNNGLLSGWTKTTIDASAAFGITAADFNLDGRMDLAYAGTNGNVVHVRLQSALGGLSGPIDSSTGFPGNIREITAGDVTGDNIPDMITTQSGQIMRGDGAGHFTPIKMVPGTGRPQLVDYNADGRMDVAVCNTGNVIVMLQ